MKKTIKKIALFVVVGALLTSCAKRDDDKISVINDDNKTETENIMTWNDKKIEKRLGNESDAFSIDATVDIYTDEMYIGQIKKEMPDKELIEKNLCDDHKMKAFSYDNTEDSEVRHNTYVIYDDENNISQIYDYSSICGKYENNKYDNEQIHFSDQVASDLDAKNNPDMLQYEKIFSQLELNVKAAKYFFQNQDGKELTCVEFYTMLDGAPILDTIFGMHYTSIELVNNEIKNVSFLPKYQFDGEKKKVEKIIAPDKMIDIISADYDNGKLALPVECSIDKIELVYIEIEGNKGVPAWVFISNSFEKTEDVAVFVYDAIDGTKIYNIMED